MAVTDGLYDRPNAEKPYLTTYECQPQLYQR